MATITVSDVTLNAVQTLGKIYSFLYNQLQQANVPLPPPDRVNDSLANMAIFATSNVPPIFRQFYTTLSQLPVQTNFFAIITSLVALYVIYGLIMTTLRSIFRLVFGFIRFTFIIAMVVSVLLVVNQYFEIPLLQDFLGTVLVQQQQQQQQQRTV
ncbi:hypothetical protein BX666DRAFT_1986450 [Dichotomocladium elegans]|nr:hypothetical protein BX666DRAFT_1986450 [Dichotomocladium elegans]